jgi:hypothetical protein
LSKSSLDPPRHRFQRLTKVRAARSRGGSAKCSSRPGLKNKQNAWGVRPMPPPSPKKTLRLPKSRPRNRGTIFCTPKAPVARDPIAHVAGGGGLTTAGARARGSELVMLVMRLAVFDSNWLARSMQWPIASVISWILSHGSYLMDLWTRLSAGQVNRNGRQNQRQDAQPVASTLIEKGSYYHW